MPERDWTKRTSWHAAKARREVATRAAEFQMHLALTHDLERTTGDLVRASRDRLDAARGLLRAIGDADAQI